MRWINFLKQIFAAKVRRKLALKMLPVVLVFVAVACAGQSSQGGTAWGQGSYLLGPGLPTVFTFDRNSVSCAVSWGSLAAPGPGPYTDAHYHLDHANFGMIVYSVRVDSFTVNKNEVVMTGQARSITTVNDKIVENALYSFTVHAVDGGSPTADSFSMTLHGPGYMFDEHTFEPSADVRAGLTTGDIVISP